jgi:hypothetical protein
LVKELRVTAWTLADAQRYFEELRHEIHAIFCLVSDFEAIFPSGPDDRTPIALESWQDDPPKHQVLEGVALRFFGDLNTMMQQHYVLKLARLGDPASSNTPRGKRSNLTIEGMQAALRALGRTTAEIESNARALSDFIEVSAKPARNRIVAHSDWETHRDKLTVGGASDQQTAEFHSQLQKYSDAVARTLALDPSQLVGTNAGDAADLMRALKWAYKVRVTCTDTACPFQRYDIRPVRGLA